LADNSEVAAESGEAFEADASAAGAPATSGSIHVISAAAANDDPGPESAAGVHRDTGAGRDSGWQRQTSPHCGQFMKANLLKSHQFA
jgi:hypothetical protein